MGALLALWDELRALPGPFHLEMRGASMWPAAPEGSLLAVHPCASTALRPGDLVTFRRGSTVVTHRVVAVAEDGRVTAWGDSLLRPDPPIPAADVLGRAAVLRRGSLVFRSGPGLAAAARASFWTGYVAARRLGAALARISDAPVSNARTSHASRRARDAA